MKCPYCGFERFYRKDSDDPFEVYSFCYEDGRVVFDEADGECPEVLEDTEIYCDHCAWHGKEKELR